MRAGTGTALIAAGAAVGVAGVLAYASGAEVHLSPAIVSLLLAKVAFGAAGGLMVVGAIVRRRALQRSHPPALGSSPDEARKIEGG